MRFYRRDGRYLIRRPPVRARPSYVTDSDRRNLWATVAKIREREGDHEGAARARQSRAATVQLLGVARVEVRHCPQCRGVFLPYTSLQTYCSRRCREIATSPVHWLLGSRSACGGGAYWAPLSIDPDDVTCGNCKRHTSFEEAGFAKAWKISSAGW